MASKKAVGVGVLELQRPRFAAVDRFVNSGILARAGTEQIGGGLAERFDIAEVEFFRAGHGSDRPGSCRRRWFGRKSLWCR